MNDTSSRRGPRPRRGSPMPTTSFSATAEELVFLILLGNGALSSGVQESVRLLVEMSSDAAAMMDEARRLIAEAENKLEKDEFGRVPQKATYLYVAQNFWELKDE